ncbi:MAG TPA: hypothetical protein VFB38_13500 [Chthonomonadaceae bacterium]|nr:hypothetical protein [Chthonomonadaceae bacterium]
MRTHVAILGWAHILINGIHLLLGLLILLGFSGAGFLSALVGAIPLLPVLGGIGVFIFLLFAFVYLPGLLVGWGLLNYAPWARILGIVVSIFDLLQLHTPWMIALGIYGLIVLFNAETVALFERRQYR